jgi:hypothetical protein
MVVRKVVGKGHKLRGTFCTHSSRLTTFPLLLCATNHTPLDFHAPVEKYTISYSFTSIYDY